MVPPQENGIRAGPLGLCHGRARPAILRLALLFTAFALPPSAPAAETNFIPRWSLGETIEEDIVAPVALAVFNPAQTETLRQAEMQKVPPVFRHDPAVAQGAVDELQGRFAKAREEFLDLIESGFQQRALRSVAGLEDPRFGEAIVVFRSKHAGFPLTTNLAELWALGDAGAVVLDDWSAQLRRFMAAYLRPERLPDGERLTAPTIRLVPMESSPAGPDVSRAGGVTNRPVNIPRAGLFPLARYKRDLAGLASATEKPLINHLAGFLRPNCFFDETATAAARERRLQDVNVVDHYGAGTAIARRGQIVDARLQPALDAWRAHQLSLSAEQLGTRFREDLEQAQLQATQWQSVARAEQENAVATVSAVRRNADAVERRSRLLAGAAVTATAICLLFAGLWWRHRRRQRGLALSAGWAMTAADAEDSGGGAEAGLWRERALAAEARAEKATAMLRTRLLPHLARWMMGELMQRLLSQRSAVRTTQQQAELEVAELAERLEKLQAPIEDRRRAYEERISELEAELAAREQQDQVFIQARIDSTRRRMESDQPADGSWS